MRRMGGSGSARSSWIMVVCIGVGAGIWKSTPYSAPGGDLCGPKGVEKLRRICFDSRQIEIAENIDQWHGADYRYFKVRGATGACNHIR